MEDKRSLKKKQYTHSLIYISGVRKTPKNYLTHLIRPYKQRNPFFFLYQNTESLYKHSTK